MASNNAIRLMVGAVVATMAIGAVAMGAVYAQQPTGGQGAQAGAAAPMGRRMMALRRGLAQLNLTDEQKAQVKSIVQGHKDEMQAAGTQVRDARRALGDAIANDADEQTIRTAAGNLGKVQGDMAVLGAKLHKQIFSVLTPDQQAKAKAMRLQAMGRFDRFMGGRGKRGLGF
jgi:Spy/CpxP family protein refolding chaperone